jgi:hypothetical protein
MGWPDAQRFTNTPHFNNPNVNANSANFGRILSTDPNWAMGRSRQFRFGFRLTFSLRMETTE